jgi:anti-anti-sigma regulatory factor
MALKSVQYQNGVLYMRGESHLTAQDAAAWYTDVLACAASNGAPIAVILDLTQTTRIATQAYIMIADATRSKAVNSIICITRSTMITEAVQAIASISERSRFYIVDSPREAQIYAQISTNNSQPARV